MDTSLFQRARLIPISGIKGDIDQERRATSAFLAVLEVVPEFTKKLLKPLGAPRGDVTAFIEPEFTLLERKVRPDGLLVVKRGTTTWSVAIEVKTNANLLNGEQINSYLDVCRENGIDALLTISNEVLTLSGQHPTTGVDKKKTRKVSLHHKSWISILSEAQVEKLHRGVKDKEQAWILSELIRYLEEPASGAQEFNDMGAHWISVRKAAFNGTLSANDEGVMDVVKKYESLLRYASFKLASRLGVEVEPVASKAAVAEPQKHLKEVASDLASNALLRGAIRVADTVAPLEVVVDLRAKQILCTIRIEAPKEGRPLTRVNWLLRQLKSSSAETRIETWVKRGREPVEAWLLSEANTKPELLVPKDPSREISFFTVTLIQTMGSNRRDGDNSFVLSFMSALENAYQGTLQNMKVWVPQAAKLTQPLAQGHDDKNPITLLPDVDAPIVPETYT